MQVLTKVHECVLLLVRQLLELCCLLFWRHTSDASAELVVPMNHVKVLVWILSGGVRGRDGAPSGGRGRG